MLFSSPELSNVYDEEKNSIRLKETNHHTFDVTFFLFF